MPFEAQEKSGFLSRNFNLMKLTSLTIGMPMFTIVPRLALLRGALGFILWYIFLSTFLGIPVLYMELIMGQFTGLNTLDIWKVRPILSHIGYGLTIWQICIICNNYVSATWVIHYMLTSFRVPQPFYKCGPWGHRNCNIMLKNFSVNYDCIQTGEKYSYCKQLYETFPEVQYYMHMANKPERGLNLQWNLCIPSAITGIVLYLSCFKRRRSMELFLGVFIIVPTIGFVLFLLGSLLQKGILMHFDEAIDVKFDIYNQQFAWSDVLRMVIFTTSAGTGLIVNEGAGSRFRAPCYANAVLTVTANIAFHLVAVFTAAMMQCPYAYEHKFYPRRIMSMPISFLHSRVPAMLGEYDYTTFWLIIVYTSYSCVAVRTCCITFYNLLEVLSKKNTMIDKYPGLVTFASSITLFLVTIPFHGNLKENIASDNYRVAAQLLPLLIIILESFTFIFCYGLEKFCEDIHFMQGIRPGNCMKFAWIVANFLLLYCYYTLLSIVVEKRDMIHNIGLYLSGLTTLYIIGLTIVKMLVSVCKKQFRFSLRLTSAWKPRSELLQRSRAMFTAQAMTKAYLYRQYHLQARIRERQRRANPLQVNTSINI